MAIYMIAEIKVNDPVRYAKYIEKVPEIIAKYGGKYLVRGGKVTALSGNWTPEKMIVLEFPSLEQLQLCFQSPEYREIAPLREQSTQSKAVILEGC